MRPSSLPEDKRAAALLRSLEAGQGGACRVRSIVDSGVLANGTLDGSMSGDPEDFVPDSTLSWGGQTFLQDLTEEVDLDYLDDSMIF
jgi:hypothetical protein